jgi:hypothetical protein
VKSEVVPRSARSSVQCTRAEWTRLSWAILLCTLLFSLATYAQGTRGTINGTVKDPNGAPLAGARVTLTQLETNARRELTTSAEGTYSAVQLTPGHYSIKVEVSGFKTYEQKNLVLQIDQVLEIDPALALGAASEVVEVTDATPVLQTEQSSVGVVLDSHELQNTPNNGRLSLYGMYILAPGVQNLAYAQDQIQKTGVTLSVGSTRRNSYGTLGTTLDGTVNESVYLQRSQQEIPSIDAIDQFKMITNGAPAEFNQQAQIIVVTKSGTNQFHGELLEFNRSKGTGAKAYSFKTPALTSARPPYERNEYGGNFSGPILVPNLYDGRDKSFFFLAFEGFDYTYSSSTSTTQPTDKMRSGDFSDFLPGGVCYTGKTMSLVNPITGVNYTTTNGNKIPSADLNATTQTLLTQLYPHATNQNVCGSTNTYETIGYSQSARRFSARLDHKLTANDQLRATFLHAFYGPYAAGWTDSLAGGYGGIGEHDVDSILGWTHTFSPTLVLDVPASYQHLHVYRNPHSLYNFGSTIPGLGTSAGDGAPTISIVTPSTAAAPTSYTGVSDSAAGYPSLEQAYQLTPSITKILGKHTIKAGVTVLYDSYYQASIVSTGSFTFNQAYSGDSFADFLLGVPYQSGNGSPSGRYPIHLISLEYDGYAQDDWKLTQKLTFNYGLHYSKQRFADDPYHKSALWIPEQQKEVVFGNTYPTPYVSTYMSILQKYSAIETSATANMSSNPWDYLKQPSSNFAPRFGFAYQAAPKTVVRGAYGIYFNLLASDYMYYFLSQVPFQGTATYSNSKTAYNGSYFTMSNPFVTQGTFGSTTFSVNAQHKSVTPYSEAYNLELEQELPGSMALRVAFVGMHNMKQNDNGSTLSQNLNAPAGSTPRVYTGGSDLQTHYLHQPFSSISGYNAPYQHTTQNALQASLRKQYRGGSSINAQFQWTRILGVEAFANPNGSTPNDSYGPVSGITPLVLNMNYTYALPIGRGQLLLGNAGKLLNTIFSGWNYSGVGTFQSGQPVNPITNQSNTMWTWQWNSLRPNRVAGQSLYAAHKSPRGTWFNPAAFTAPTTYTGTDGGTYVNQGTASYNMLRGPGWWNLDMNLVKNIKWNRYNVQLRADSYNTFNHPNFSTPNATVYTSGTNAAFGTITSTSSTPTYEARSLEFGAKFNF